jgi:uncharacterized Fe-S center protein
MKSPISYYKTTTLSPTQLRDIFTGKFVQNEPVYIKIHFGEPGNKTAFTPEIVKPFVGALHDLGLETVLWDCPVFYRSPRDSKAGYEEVVQDKGFTTISPCEICDDYDSVELHDGKTAEIANLLTNAKNLLVLSHVKGHPAAGFGATIKNIGIGAVSPKTKGLVHEMTNPRSWRWGWNPDRLGEITSRCWQLMPQANSLFINIIRDVTKHCDCVGHTTRIIAPDLGVLVGNNLVAIDQAALDLIEQATEPGLFLKKNKVDPRFHIDAAAKYSGLTKEYDLQEKTSA